MIKEREIKGADQVALTDVYQEIPCANLSNLEKSQAIALVADAGVPEAYIEPRLDGYDIAVMNYKAEKLLAFQLVQQFTAGKDVFIYFGPAFSKRGALLQLYGWYIKELHRKFPDKNMFILAELQNPKMLMVLHGLFGDFGYSFLNKNIPASILNIVPLFCQNYSHIGQFNAGNFTTTSAYTLFKESHSCNTLSELMIRKKIFLAKGDNMLFAASVPKYPETRNAVLEQVRQGIEAVCNWGEFKNAFLNSLSEINK